MLTISQGKRKKSSRKPGGPKKREALDTTFTCLFCNHEDAISVKMDKKHGIGVLRCSNCHQDFQTSINYLSAPVDVFSDWIDACEAVAQDGIAQEEHVTEADKQFSSYANERPRGNAKAVADDEDDGGDDEDDDY